MKDLDKVQADLVNLRMESGEKPSDFASKIDLINERLERIDEKYAIDGVVTKIFTEASRNRVQYLFLPAIIRWLWRIINLDCWLPGRLKICPILNN